MRLSEAPYSFLGDADVPDFDPPAYFTVMDAHCGLCAKGAAWIARHDVSKEFRIIPMQSELGSALLRHYGMDPGDPLSWLYVQNGQAFTSLDAIMRIGTKFGGVWHALKVLRILPLPVQDWLYGVVARNRHRFMGRTDFCEISDPDVQARLYQ